MAATASQQHARAANAGAAQPDANTSTAAVLTVENGKFLLRGKPYQVLSGEMHYARIPRAYWRQRLKMAKAMGLNTISTYVFWNLHEPSPGVYNFAGNLDVAEFIREAQQEGLNVILRPGPYVCAEWDLGGYPAWLLANPKMVLRSNDPVFMVPAERWMMRLGKELAPLQASRGGPIVAIQLENEYGSFGDDKTYLQHMRQIWLRAGFGGTLMYTADGAKQLLKGTLPGILAVVNLGAGSAKDSFEQLAKFEPGKPLMSGEYWDGWYDQWGKPHVVKDVKMIEDEYAWMLAQGYSVNLYMFHGGTSFGWMNGANIYNDTYFSDVTSYDYDAPLDESGRPTPLYFGLRNIIAQHDRTAGLPEPGPVPATVPAITIPRIAMTDSVSLWNSLPSPVQMKEPLSMEQIGQSYGYILYRTTLPRAGSGELVLANMQDYAQIYLDGTLAGTLDRRLHQDRLKIDASHPGTRLDILVENSGRVNFSKAIRTQWKGIRGQVTFDGAPLTAWQAFPLPMESSDTLPFMRTGPSGAAAPAFYRGTFTLEQVGDTFLDTRGLTKGSVWLNGHPLGRFWDIGPQQTLYVPGPWLKRGTNSLVIFDLSPDRNLMLKALSKPILARPTQP